MIQLLESYSGDFHSQTWWFNHGSGHWFNMSSKRFQVYPLVNVYITMENHHFQWENPLQMVIFNSYVSLPDGICSEEYSDQFHNHLTSSVSHKDM